MTLTDSDREEIERIIGPRENQSLRTVLAESIESGILYGKAVAIADAARDTLDLAIAMDELWNIAHAKRFRKTHFDDDTSFADWAQSRATHTLHVRLRVRLHPDYRPGRALP